MSGSLPLLDEAFCRDNKRDRCLASVSRENDSTGSMRKKLGLPRGVWSIAKAPSTRTFARAKDTNVARLSQTVR